MLNFRALKVSTKHKWYNTENKNIRNWMFVWMNVPVSHTLNTKTYQQILRSVTFWGLRCLLNGLQDPEKLFLSPEKRCPFNRGNKYKDSVHFFPGPNLVFPEKTCPKRQMPVSFIHSPGRKTPIRQWQGYPERSRRSWWFCLARAEMSGKTTKARERVVKLSSLHSPCPFPTKTASYAS